MVLVVALVVPVGLFVPIDVEAIEAAQVETIDERPDLTSLAGAGLLVEPEVDAAVDPRVVDVAGDLAERVQPASAQPISSLSASS